MVVATGSDKSSKFTAIRFWRNREKPCSGTGIRAFSRSVALASLPWTSPQETARCPKEYISASESYQTAITLCVIGSCLASGKRDARRSGTVFAPRQGSSGALARLVRPRGDCYHGRWRGRPSSIAARLFERLGERTSLCMIARFRRVLITNGTLIK